MSDLALQTLLNADKLFFYIALEFCADGKISSEEFKLLQKVSGLLGLKNDMANEIANRAIAVYKKGNSEKQRIYSVDDLYQALLIKLSTDGILDADEDSVLQNLKSIFKIDVGNFKKFDPAAGKSKIRLKPLLCSNCKGSLPLVKQEWVDCPYCAKKNSIPLTYLDAIAARGSLVKHKSRLHEIRASVGKVPTLFETTIAYFPDSLVFFLFMLFLLFFQHYINALVFYPVSHYYQKSLLKSFFDFTSPISLAIMKAFVLYVLLAFPFAFIYKTKRKVAVLGPLQASLAAGPPAMPGGPVTCNNCGAGLVVEQNSHIVACGYCETENLVGLPENWLRTARSRLSGARKSAAEAIRAFKKETGLLYETLLCLAILFVVYALILSAFYSINRDDYFLPRISKDQAHRKVIFTDKSVMPPLEFSKWERISFSYAPTSRKFVDLFFFLDAGEKIEITWKPDMEYYREKQQEMYYLRDKLVPERMNCELYLTHALDFSGETRMKKEQSLTMTSNRSYEFTAEISGYHNLRCFFPEHLFKFYLKLARL